MLKQDVRAELTREPFVPLRIFLNDGKHYDVPFPEVARYLGYGVLIFIGMKDGGHSADSFDRLGFDEIDRIEQRRGGSKRRNRKKAS